MNKNNKKFRTYDPLDRVGILDPNGERENPYTQGAYTSDYNSDWWTKLPMYENVEKKIEIFRDNQVVLLTSSTGSGKSVLGPFIAMHSIGYDGNIIVTMPRVVITIGGANTAASVSNTKIGEEIGYSTKNDKKKSDKTRILFATDQTLVNELTSDPLIKKYKCIVCDEVHELTTSTSTIMMLVKRAMKFRPDLKLILMSATADVKMFENYFAKEFKFAHIDVAGKTMYPIKEIFLEKDFNVFGSDGVLKNTIYVDKAVEKTIEVITKEEPGNILVFLPKKNDLVSFCMKLSKLGNEKILCKGISSESSQEDNEIFKSAILFRNMGFDILVTACTTVCEAGITAGDLTYVIDSGLNNDKWYDAESNCDKLKIKLCTKSSHIQRKGRTGRTKPGTCYNLFTKHEYEKMLDFPIPPMYKTDVINQVLEFMTYKDIIGSPFPFSYKKKYTISKPNELIPLDNLMHQFITPPKENFVQISLVRLYALGALTIDNNQATITQTGRAMYDLMKSSRAFEMKPEMAKVLITSYNYRCADDMCDVMGMIENDISKFYPNDSQIRKGKNENRLQKELIKVQKSFVHKNGDVMSTLQVFREFKKIRYSSDPRVVSNEQLDKDLSEWAKENFVQARRFKDAYKLSKNIKRALHQLSSNQMYQDVFQRPKELYKTTDSNIIFSLLSGFYVNLARQITSGAREYLQCFPATQSNIITFDRESVFAQGFISKKPKFAIYMSLDDYASGLKMKHITNVSDAILKNFSKQLTTHIELIQKCLKKQTKTTKQNPKRSQKKRYR